MGTCCATPNNRDGKLSETLASSTVVEEAARAKLEDDYGLDDLPKISDKDRRKVTN